MSWNWGLNLPKYFLYFYFFAVNKSYFTNTFFLFNHIRKSNCNQDFYSSCSSLVTKRFFGFVRIGGPRLCACSLFHWPESCSGGLCVHQYYSPNFRLDLSTCWTANTQYRYNTSVEDEWSALAILKYCCGVTIAIAWHPILHGFLCKGWVSFMVIYLGSAETFHAPP